MIFTIIGVTIYTIFVMVLSELFHRNLNSEKLPYGATEEMEDE